MDCYYCDDPFSLAEMVDLDGNLFCHDCAKCTYCGKEAVTRRPSLLCEQCQEDDESAAKLREKHLRLTEGDS